MDFLMGNVFHSREKGFWVGERPLEGNFLGKSGKPRGKAKNEGKRVV